MNWTPMDERRQLNIRTKFVIGCPQLDFAGEVGRWGARLEFLVTGGIQAERGVTPCRNIETKQNALPMALRL